VSACLFCCLSYIFLSLDIFACLVYHRDGETKIMIIPMVTSDELLEKRNCRGISKGNILAVYLYLN